MSRFIDGFTAAFLLLEAAFALFLLYREGLLKKPSLAAVALWAVPLAFFLRAVAFNYETQDYQVFLTRWVDFFRVNGGFRGLSMPVGNYNIPYLYFLALFSYMDVKDLYLIKLLSVFFDVLLAYSCMKLLGRVESSPAKRLSCFLAVLFLPTVYLNGALWGQCDSIYVSLGLLGIYLALDERPVPAMICAALSFGFKLQAVFILPAYAILWMYGKFNWKHFLIFPVVYVALVLPAVLLGRPFIDTLTLYLGQADSVGTGLNYNSPSFFAFLSGSVNVELASRLGVAGAFAFMLAVLALCFFKRRRLNDRAVLTAALLLAVGIPFLLPHMHERYFFAADVLSLVFAFFCPVLSVSALLAQFASLLGYHAYLRMQYFMIMNKGSTALLILIAVVFCRLIYELSGSRGKKLRA